MNPQELGGELNVMITYGKFLVVLTKLSCAAFTLL